MVAQTISPPRTASQGTKRSADDLEITPTKRRRLYHRHHVTRHRQSVEADPVLHCQDERFFQSQLDRSLASVLCAAGFDTATPDAFEALRASSQEFMLHFAARVRQAMLSSRRNQPLPQDFVMALSHTSLASSDLLPHVTTPVPPDFALPKIDRPPSGEVQPPNLAFILGDELRGKEERVRRRYISKNFPKLPSTHTWKNTEVFPAREIDPRKIREGATREGILAEQALRKLAAAKKSNAPSRRGEATSARSRAEWERSKVWEDAVASTLRHDEEEQRKFEERTLAEDGAAGSPMEPSVRRSIELRDVDNGLVVNHDRRNWRKPPGTVIRT